MVSQPHPLSVVLALHLLNVPSLAVHWLSVGYQGNRMDGLVAADTSEVAPQQHTASCIIM